MQDGEGWELAGASETRSYPKTQLLWSFYVGNAIQGSPLGGKKRSFKVVAGAGCFFPLAPTAAQSPFPVSRGPEAMPPGGARSSSLHPAPTAEERKIIPAAKHRLARRQSQQLPEAIRNWV